MTTFSCELSANKAHARPVRFWGDFKCYLPPPPLPYPCLFPSFSLSVFVSVYLSLSLFLSLLLSFSAPLFLTQTTLFLTQTTNAYSLLPNIIPVLFISAFLPIESPRPLRNLTKSSSPPPPPPKSPLKLP